MMLANHDVPTLVAVVWQRFAASTLSLFDSDDQLGEALAGREHEKQQHFTVSRSRSVSRGDDSRTRYSNLAHGG